ncbi:hypothetical protein M514_12746 [Trichuris suis]|uniref:Uncharacterized protein n=1 Tax=Trichuris suis TaxID=68888 RepID=A0A085LN29_9BILA|nr:hypothetical protein M513_12746 [Trichuris suis]KFD65023.1 hypothetical protein M514_12746 [Trichuris suis]
MTQKEVLIRKLNSLYCSQSWEFRRSERLKSRSYCTGAAAKTVTNLGSIQLNDVQTQVLDKGLNFVPTPKQAPLFDIITSVEHSVTSVDSSKAAVIRGAIVNTLSQRAPRVTSNLTSLEQKALKDLRRNPDLIITKADKGNVVVLLDRST